MGQAIPGKAEEIEPERTDRDGTEACRRARYVRKQDKLDKGSSAQMSLQVLDSPPTRADTDTRGDQRMTSITEWRQDSNPVPDALSPLPHRNLPKTQATVSAEISIR